MAVVKLHSVPEIRIVNRSELSEIFECSLTTIDDRVKAGMPCIKRPTESDKGWKFDFKACIEWLVKRDSGISDGDVDPDTLSPREMDYFYAAQKKKLEVGKLKGDLVLLSEVMQENSLRYGVIAQRLRTLPDILERNYGLDTRMAMAAEDFINDLLFNIGQELKGVDN
jgi:phage terminase Nu1 subunit (DNA packaging protein)